MIEYIRSEQQKKLDNALITREITQHLLESRATEDDIVEAGLGEVSINPRFLWGVLLCIKGLEADLR